MTTAKQLEGYVGIDFVMAHKAFRQKGERALGRLGLRVGQELVLIHLCAERALSQGQLAERLGVEQATVSIMLRRMAKAGLVGRRSDKDDARVTRVYATRKGRALERPVLRVWRDQERQLLAGLTAEEKRLLRRLLAHIRANLEPRRSDHGTRTERA
jgi:DNA-binding MarR family transcriptional regulator